ncbi:MAG TPA: hypothetical protein PKA41_18085 [Verrucomicrobiota bacterium]|nr:hypothetical protein [Verrucomicrobiota bacterium]
MNPARFDIYEDRGGRHFVLIEKSRVDGVWLALCGAKLHYLSHFNLSRMQLIGRATFD